MEGAMYQQQTLNESAEISCLITVDQHGTLAQRPCTSTRHLTIQMKSDEKKP